MSDRPNTLLEAQAVKGRPQLVNRDREMIPTVLLKAMLILALSALAITIYAVTTDRPLVGQPLPAPVTETRDIVFDGTRSGEVAILTPDGATLVAEGSEISGFYSVVWRAFSRQRMLAGLATDTPLRLDAHANGRLVLTDPETGWSVELASFGAANRDAFGALLAK